MTNAQSTYQEFSALPTFEAAVYKDGKILPWTTTLPRWSGSGQPPALDAIIQVRMNNLGAAKVIGYFVEQNWLGVLVKFYAPPKWFTTQNGYNAKGHLFGVDIGEVLTSAPDVPGPTQEQLEALQRFATATGPKWKSALSLAWETGADERESDGHLLRQVRNQHGPAWLHSDENPVMPKAPR